MGLTKEEALEIELKAIIEYRLEFYAECEKKVKDLHQKEMDRLKTSLEQSKAKIRELTQQGVSSKAEINQQLTTTTHLEEKLKTVDKERETLIQEKTSALRKVDALEEKVKVCQREAKQDAAELKRLRHLEPEKLKGRLHEATSELKTVKKQAADSAKLARSRKSEIERLTRQVKEQEARLKELEEEPEESVA